MLEISSKEGGGWRAEATEEKISSLFSKLIEAEQRNFPKFYFVDKSIAGWSIVWMSSPAQCSVYARLVAGPSAAGDTSVSNIFPGWGSREIRADFPGEVSFKTSIFK